MVNELVQPEDEFFIKCSFKRNCRIYLKHRTPSENDPTFPIARSEKKGNTVMSVHKFKQSNFTGNAKWAFTTRRVDQLDVQGLNSDVSGAVSGDLVLCEILEINQHKKLQLANRRYSDSYVGDRIVVCLGDRYAPDQFEGRAELDGESADLIAAGGVVGQVEHAHQSMSRPTKVRTLGLLTDAHDKVINISRYALPPSSIPLRLTVIGVVGASMNSGKNDCVCKFGTRFGACWISRRRCQSHRYRSIRRLQCHGGCWRAGTRLHGCRLADHLSRSRFRTLSGVLKPSLAQRRHGAPKSSWWSLPMEFFNVRQLQILSSSAIRDRLDGVMFAAPDALSSAGGVAHLESIGLSPFAVSGKVTCSPLATKEAYTVTGVPHLSRGELCDPAAVVPAVRSVIRAFLVEREDAA